jgi:hypothetical protein
MMGRLGELIIEALGVETSNLKKKSSWGRALSVQFITNDLEA